MARTAHARTQSTDHEKKAVVADGFEISDEQLQHIRQRNAGGAALEVANLEIHAFISAHGGLHGMLPGRISPEVCSKVGQVLEQAHRSMSCPWPNTSFEEGGAPATCFLAFSLLKAFTKKHFNQPARIDSLHCGLTTLL